MTGKHSNQSTTPKQRCFEGHSGTQVEIFDCVVKKTAHSKEQCDRLLKQMHKQKQWAAVTDGNELVTAPMVVGSDGKTYFEMSKVVGLDFYTRIHEVDSEISQTTAMKIIQTIMFMQQRCKPGLIPSSVIEAKLSEMNFHKQAQLYVLDIMKNKQIMTHVGFHHGDFSLANMLFQWDGKVALFDFLEDIAEAPIFDIIKLRLDVVHHWTLCLNNLKATKEYIKFCFFLRERLDWILVDTYKLTADEVSALTVMWMLRILKYAKDKQVAEHLEEAIQQEMQCPLLYCPQPVKAQDSQI